MPPPFNPVRGMNLQASVVTPNSPGADSRHGEPMAFVADDLRPRLMAHLLVGLCQHLPTRHTVDDRIVVTRQPDEIDFK